MECEPSLTNTATHTKPCESTCSSSNVADKLARASDTLTQLAQQKGFTVHDVPGDGNCLFNAIAYTNLSLSMLVR